MAYLLASCQGCGRDPKLEELSFRSDSTVHGLGMGPPAPRPAPRPRREVPCLAPDCDASLETASLKVEDPRRREAVPRREAMPQREAAPRRAGGVRQEAAPRVKVPPRAEDWREPPPDLRIPDGDTLPMDFPALPRCRPAHGAAGDAAAPCAVDAVEPRRPPRTDSQELADMAKRLGWKRCPQCKTYCEKDSSSGSSVACVCGHEFCWSCLADGNKVRFHGNHFHEVKCRLYGVYWMPTKFEEKCPHCVKSGEACKPPKPPITQVTPTVLWEPGMPLERTRPTPQERWGLFVQGLATKGPLERTVTRLWTVMTDRYDPNNLLNGY